MATSAYQNTVCVMDILVALEPGSVLDVGAGFGRWGFLCRCHLGEGSSITAGGTQNLRIEAVEVFKGNLNPVYDAVYDKTYLGDAVQVVPSLGRYDVVICGDMIEHLPKADGWKLIDEMQKHAGKALVLSLPMGECEQGEKYGNKYEIHKSTWSRSDFESKGVFLREFKCHGDLRVAVVVFPLDDHSRWLVRWLNNPLKRCLYAIQQKVRKMITGISL